MSQRVWEAQSTGIVSGSIVHMASDTTVADRSSIRARIDRWLGLSTSDETDTFRYDQRLRTNGALIAFAPVSRPRSHAGKL